MKKRILAGIMASAMAVSMAGCTQTNDPATTNAPTNDNADTVADDSASSVDASSEGKVLNIYGWNAEFKSRFESYYTVPEGITVKWNITPSDDNAYQNKLDEDLLSQDSKSADEKIDIFLIEADYALKYVNSDYSLDVKSIGLTDADVADMYQYTKDIATDASGALKAVSWQATPGLFVYRRSIAKDVLGTDDPAEVQAALSDWTKFDDVASKASEKGYKMLSGYEDSYRVFSNNVSAPWVNENNEIIVDDNILNWVEQTKIYTDKGYNNKTVLWQPEWSADQSPSGKVFGFFYSTWGINFTLLGNAIENQIPNDENGVPTLSKTTTPEEYEEFMKGNGIYGDYAVCEGPQSYYWGGSWICASSSTDNPTIVADVMRVLTCDPDVAERITLDTEDYTNNISAMSKIANSDYSSSFLGGQNHIAQFAVAAPKIDMSNTSPYDQGLNETFQKCFEDYFSGAVDYDTAMANFYEKAIIKYPELKKPNA